jgi:hypothetical protein
MSFPLPGPLCSFFFYFTLLYFTFEYFNASVVCVYEFMEVTESYCKYYCSEKPCEGCKERCLLCNEAHSEPTKFVLTFTSESFEDSILLWHDVALFCRGRESLSSLQKPQNENILLSQLLPDNQILKLIMNVGCNE